MNANESDSIQEAEQTASDRVIQGETSGKVKKKRAPTKKELKYLENRKAGQGKKEAAINAGYAPSTADKSTAKIENNIHDLMDAAGLTATKLLAKLAEGLEATKLYGKEGIEHPDYGAQHRFVTTALQMRNMLEPQPQFDSKVNIIVNSKEVQVINQQFVQFVMQYFGGRK